MRKILIPLLLMIMLSTSVFAAWGASRAITGNDVTITVSPGDGFDTFTITEAVKGATIVDGSFPASCGLASNKLTCDYEGTTPVTISYKTAGTGQAGGTIFAVNSADFSSASATITGDAEITAPLQCIEDKDNDGYGKECPLGPDCDDTNSAIGGKLNYYPDKDGDGYGNPGEVPMLSCTKPVNYVADNTDCKDNNEKINPAATEICNTVDDDCDGQMDEGFNFQTDEANCGACGTVCDSGLSCIMAACVASPEQQALDAVLSAISAILQSEDNTLDKLSSIAAQLFSYFS